MLNDSSLKQAQTCIELVSSMVLGHSYRFVPLSYILLRYCDEMFV